MDFNSIEKAFTKKEGFDNGSNPKYDINFDDVTIIVPTLDEEEAISFVIDDLQIEGYDNILIVDGNSKDNTIEIVKEKKIPYITQKGKGKTGAILSALKYVKTPYIVLIDGDRTYAAKNIQNLFPYISEFDEVIGARETGRENITKLNQFGNRFINFYFNVLFDTKLSDVCSGMYLLKTEFAKSLILETEGFDIEVEIAAHAALNKSIVESPIDFFSRLGTQKLNPLSDGLKILTTISKMAMKYQRLRFISFIAIMMMFPGILLLSYPFIFNILRYDPSSYFIGLLFLVFSVQGFILLFIDSRFLKKDNINKKNRVKQTKI